ncbi:DUF7736 domain-containing protein [Agrobacterium pusense]|uniref:DUF7736 domain-containing protein n=1 Tax=Agrobacterium pusense TaxID=648995 RepID=UPI000EB90CC0|nr:hypothetical protein [Agrobacterium pusense]HCJ71004.1 hypothetical protein [Agrobacterium sp.]
MSETKEFSTLLVATVHCGISVTHTTFSEIQECAEWLCGHPVWTHELAHPKIQERYKAAALAQFPLLPSRSDVETDIMGAKAKVLATYGETVLVERGDFERNETPIDTLRDLRPDVEVVVAKI